MSREIAFAIETELDVGLYANFPCKSRSDALRLRERLVALQPEAEIICKGDCVLVFFSEDDENIKEPKDVIDWAHDALDPIPWIEIKQSP